MKHSRGHSREKVELANGAFVQKGSMILVCVARFTQAVAMEDRKSVATVHPTPDKYGTQQVHIFNGLCFYRDESHTADIMQ